MTDSLDETRGFGDVVLPQADGDDGRPEMRCDECGYVAVDRGNGATADYWHHMSTHGYGPGGPALDGER